MKQFKLIDKIYKTYKDKQRLKLGYNVRDRLTNMTNDVWDSLTSPFMDFLIFYFKKEENKL